MRSLKRRWPMRKFPLLVDGEMVSWYGSRAARGLRWLMALRRGMA